MKDELIKINGSQDEPNAEMATDSRIRNLKREEMATDSRIRNKKGEEIATNSRIRN
jgi:hypothetical protein